MQICPRVVRGVLPRTEAWVQPHVATLQNEVQAKDSDGREVLLVHPSHDTAAGAWPSAFGVCWLS